MRLRDAQAVILFWIGIGRVEMQYENRTDIMVDIETLGTKADSTIIQIAAVAFNITTGKVIDTVNMIADIAKNKGPLNAAGRTLKWWMETNKELFNDLLSDGDKASEEILEDFQTWIINLPGSFGDHYLWGNGILFDNRIIQHQLEALGLRYPIHYRNDRDVRTILEMASMKLGVTEEQLKESCALEGRVEHDALDDARYQTALVLLCYRILMGEVLDGED